jgi:hypothetical protein
MDHDHDDVCTCDEHPDQPATLVRHDIEDALSHAFSSTDGVLVTRADLTNADHTATAVVWEFPCRHTGIFQGLNATHKDLTVRGTTIVQQDGDVTLFRRFIDWAEVMTGLGMYASFRPTISSEDSDRRLTARERG